MKPGFNKGKALGMALMNSSGQKPGTLPVGPGLMSKMPLYNNPGEVKLVKKENSRIKGLI